MDTLLLRWKEKSASVAAEIGVDDDVVFWGFPIGLFMFLFLTAVLLFSGGNSMPERETRPKFTSDVFSAYR